MKVGYLAVFTLCCGLVAGAWAQEETASPADQLKKNPNDVQVMNQYVGAQLRAAMGTMGEDAKKALAIIEELDTTLAGLEPTEPQAKQLLMMAKSAVKRYRTQIELRQTSLEELTAKLGENPGDVKSIELYGAKVMQDASGMARSEPDKAEAAITSAKTFLADLREKVKDNEDATKAIDDATNMFSRLDRQIAAAKKLKELIGKDASPLMVEAWVNGSPLTDEDLKGKVVLLDFWAVWCGPCKATFPHLREWQEQFASKGLEIIGVTSYYKLVWDEEKGDYKRGEGEVTPEQEQEMLAKFAEHNKLAHRFALDKEGQMSEFYGVTGIPQAVVIDREGKIRLIKVGSGEANAKEIEDLLKELIGDQA